MNRGSWLRERRACDLRIVADAYELARATELQRLLRSFRRQIEAGRPLTERQREVAMRALSAARQAHHEEAFYEATTHPLDKLALPLRPPGR